LRRQGLFELESRYMLEVNLNGMVWTKLGSMVAYSGDVKFDREGILEHGVGKLLKKAVSGEGARLTKAIGTGTVYLADAGKEIQILNLDNESIYVNGNDLLAFEDGIQWDVKMMKKVTAMMAGGLFNVRLEGTGMIAITSHFEPMTLVVHVTTPDADPVTTTPFVMGLASASQSQPQLAPLAPGREEQRRKEQQRRKEELEKLAPDPGSGRDLINTLRAVRAK